ncbi:transcriptional regulator GcvA [Asticcacaulis tiandongensis]|uniref:transcriptional regulator GcvA n=1 Tax=Asticcacaulis tiandongensis TaxID=2565365 RepID=UPI00112E2EE4|nr:transcriptional regulator GcvA [Asticcacaulis tiandongensis]
MSRDRLPPLSALRVFEAAARHESFKHAAEELFVTPGAVSQQIRLLEEHVGVELFVRDGRRVVLSDAGRASALILKEAFEKMFEATRVMKQTQQKGRVTVSAAPSFTAKWLMPRLGDFSLANPDIDVWISADMSPTDFAVSDIDLAIRYGNGNYSNLHVEHLLEESVIPVCSPALYDAAPIRKAADLAHHVLLHDISADTDPSCPDWAMWLKAHGVDDVDAARGPRFNQSHMVIEAAVAGRGVALAKRTIAEADLRAGRLKVLFNEKDAPVSFGYYLVWPQTRDPSLAQTRFMDWLRQQASGDTPASARTQDRPVFAAQNI